MDSAIYKEVTPGYTDILGAEEGYAQVGFAGMFLCMEGEVEIVMDGRTYTLCHGCLVAYTPYSTLHIVRRSVDLRGIIMGVSLERIQRLLCKITDFKRLLFIRQAPFVNLGGGRMERLLTYIELYRDCFSDGEGGDGSVEAPNIQLNKMKSELLTECIALEVISLYSAEGAADSLAFRRQDEVLRKFVVALRQHYKKEHKVAFYAARQFITDRYFSNIIKERSGQTPSQWITNALLGEAKHLLRHTDMSIKEISERLNFPNQSYFGKWFKNLSGVGPLDFRSGKGKQM